MSPNTARWIRMIASAAISGVTAAGATLMTKLSDPGQLSQTTVIIALVTGVMFFCTDIKSYLSQPPEVLGGTELPPEVPPHS